MPDLFKWMAYVLKSSFLSTAATKITWSIPCSMHGVIRQQLGDAKVLRDIYGRLYILPWRVLLQKLLCSAARASCTELDL